jgi:hypothetical protein
MTYPDRLIHVTVTADDVAGIPESATGHGSMLVITGTADDGSRVKFRATGRFIRVVLIYGEDYLTLEPQEILTGGGE